MPSAQCQPLTHDSSPLTAVQFTGDWETGWVTANTSYKSFSRAVVNADIGLHIGLAGVNVTLVGECATLGCINQQDMAHMHSTGESFPGPSPAQVACWIPWVQWGRKLSVTCSPVSGWVEQLLTSPLGTV